MLSVRSEVSPFTSTHFEPILDSFVYMCYVVEKFSLVYKNMLSVGREASPFTSTHFEPIRDDGAVFNPYDV